MAECADRRGNIIQVQQVNHGDPRFQSTSGHITSTLCFVLTAVFLGIVSATLFYHAAYGWATLYAILCFVCIDVARMKDPGEHDS